MHYVLILEVDEFDCRTFTYSEVFNMLSLHIHHSAQYTFFIYNMQFYWFIMFIHLRTLLFYL